MADDIFNNFWDDELRDLEARARALFGEDAVLTVVERAESVLLASDAQPSMSVAQVLKYRDAVKAELRRLITPQ
jgi:hypothetical protein